MIKSNRLTMFLLRVELFATFEQFIHIAFYLHVHNYKSKLTQGRTKPAKLWLQALDNYLGNKFLNAIRFIKNENGRFIF